jgi:predicted RNase H-related nuclease YkuK (DUF458 family)
MFSRRKLSEVQTFIQNQSEQSKIYIGCDSEAYKKNNKRYADYFLVVVVHIDQSHGCKIFGEKITEIDYTTDKKRPTFRLMNEVYKASNLYLELAEAIGDRDCEIHLDINTQKKHASSLVLEQAIGYVKGTCNIIPLVKPDSWAATHVADKFLKNITRNR